jgi:hypothetical protein
MKWLGFHLLLLAAVVVAPSAGAQVVPLQTGTDDLVGGTVDTSADTVGGLTQSVSGGLDNAVSTTHQTATGVLDPATGSSGDSTSSTSGSASTEGTASGGPSSSGERAGSTAPGKRFNSRFDRLPLRLERLLERIELGRNVRENLRRLQQALASLSAQERARVARLLNAEIRRLRVDGVSSAERKRIERLIRAHEQIAAFGTPTATSAVGGAGAGDPATGPPLAGGVLGATAAGDEAPAEKGAQKEGATGQSGSPGILDADGFPFRILVALGTVLLVILGGLAVKEEWVA